MAAIRFTGGRKRENQSQVRLQTALTDAHRNYFASLECSKSTAERLDVFMNFFDFDIFPENVLSLRHIVVPVSLDIGNWDYKLLEKHKAVIAQYFNSTPDLVSVLEKKHLELVDGIFSEALSSMDTHTEMFCECDNLCSRSSTTLEELRKQDDENNESKRVNL